jgi:hypothetical protein
MQSDCEMSKEHERLTETDIDGEKSIKTEFFENATNKSLCFNVVPSLTLPVAMIPEVMISSLKAMEMSSPG